MTAMTLTGFYEIFPEFEDVVAYPGSVVQFWIDFSNKMINSDAWKTLTPNGQALLAAHMISLSAMNGQIQGLDTGQNADGLSYSTDVSSIAIAGAGHYNQTLYGNQYKMLIRIVGAGCTNVI